MKNLSKVLAVVLALVMALSMVSFAAYTDVADDANYAEAVSVLSSLEMLKGYEDGTFKPEGDITRAEFAMVVCRLLGYGAAAEKPAATIFNDVAADHWASGAVALAASQGIVNGYGDGNFGPEDNVTYEQAIKMVVAALGYTVVAEANGGYPGGFQIVAAQAGILDGITDGKAGVAASRGVVAQLAYNALDVPMMAQTSFGTDVAYGYTNTTLLNRIGVVKAQATVVGTQKTNSTLKADEVQLTLTSQYTAVKGEATIQNPSISWNSVTSRYEYSIGSVNPNLLGATVVTNGKVKVDTASGILADVTDLLDREAVVYIKNATGNKPELVAIAAKEAGYNEITFASEFINEAEGVYTLGTPGDYTTATEVTKIAKYTDEAKEDFEKYNVAISKVYVNGREVGDASTAAATFAAFAHSGAEADIKLLDGQLSDETYDTAYITSYVDFVVKRIYADDYELIASDYNVPTALASVYTGFGSSIILDEEEETFNFEIIKDGEKVDFSEIAVNDVLSIAGNVNANDELIFGTVIVNTQSVDGKVSGTDTDNDIIYIDGVEYAINADVKSDVLGATLKIGTETTFYINARGVICGWNTEAKTDNLKYGFVTVAEKDGLRDFTIRMMDAEGTWNTYGTASKVTVDGTLLSDTALATLAGAVTAVTEGTDEIVFNQVVGYELNGDGEIKTLYTVDDNNVFDIDSDSDSYNSISETLGSFLITDSVVVFNAPVTAAGSLPVEEADVAVANKSNFVHDETYSVDAYNVEDGVPTVLFGEDVIGRMDWAADFMVITGKTIKANANEDIGVEITGLVGGETVTIFATDAKVDVNEIDWSAAPYVGTDITTGTTTPDATLLNIGDVIMFNTDATGEATQIVRVLNATDNVKAKLATTPIDLAGTAVALGTTSAAGIDYTWYLGYVSDLTANGIVIKNGSADTTNNLALSLKNSPDTAEVNFFAAGGKTTVAKGNEGSFRADTGLENADTARNDGDIVLVRATNTTLAESAVVFKAKK